MSRKVGIVPTRVGDGTNWATVSAGHEHTVAIRTDNSVWVWGRDNFYGFTDPPRVPTQVFRRED